MGTITATRSDSGHAREKLLSRPIEWLAMALAFAVFAGMLAAMISVLLSHAE
jgi:hypothetical protein